jgi:uncharacterized protein with PIN domain
MWGRCKRLLSPDEEGNMSLVEIRFYAELNDYLPEAKRYTAFRISIDNGAPVRDVLSSLGVPEEQIDLVLVNGKSVGLEHVVKENDTISAYPVYESFDISSVTKVRQRPLRQPRFVLDCHLGKLAYYLRMLGFDTLYHSNFHDKELIEISNAEARTLLSRDRKLVEESPITRGYRVRETDPKLQVVEVLRRFDLFRSTAPLQRCLRCNTYLVSIGKEKVIERLPARIRESYHQFQTCPTCNRVYWQGSHYQRMQEFIARVLASESALHFHVS